ncbi:MAG: transglutaminase domain-containing protein [Candidatus Hydrogenedentes bacterium]|nr:transglutaminase domain-containing protein [Candidatus Hydrogenedentota bacterium]
MVNVLLMLGGLFLLTAPEDVPLDLIRQIQGDNWYGVYMNGGKVGYSVNRLQVRDDQQAIVLTEDALFLVTMSGVKQNMRLFTERTYDMSTGRLSRIHASITDPSQKSEFTAEATGDVLRVVSVIGNNRREKEFPLPAETVWDGLRQSLWVLSAPDIGNVRAFRVFEPLYERELSGQAQVTAIEERLMDGVPTRVYTIRNRIDVMEMDSTARVSASGLILEETLSGNMTLRLEPEAMAKDVSYQHDVIMANAARVDRAIENPRTRSCVGLTLIGPLSDGVLFNDNRQRISRIGENRFAFVGRIADLDRLNPPGLPLERVPDDVSPWLQPSAFAQSDLPAIREKARALKGNERDSLVVARILCRWVYENMRTTYSARMSNALEVLEHMEGDCTEHSVLMTALARAAGIPARENAGLIYIPGRDAGFYFHQWVEVWVGEWVAVDPTFNQVPADATHVKLVEGDLLQQSRILPLVGRIQITVDSGVDCGKVFSDSASR